jgi:hypothetical protein
VGLFLLAVDEIFASIEFSIGNATQTNDEIEVEATIKGLSSSSCFENKCYLQGVLTASDQNQYFGFTQNNQSNWYEYASSPEVELIKSTFYSIEPKEGSWSGKLKIKNNPGDSDYKGPGTYSLQVRRYSGKSSSHAGESNTLTVQLSYVLPTPTPVPTGGTPQPTSTPTPASSKTPNEAESASTPTPNPTDEALVGKVAGLSFTETEINLEATQEAEVILLSSSDSASPAGATTDIINHSPTSKNWPFFLIGGSFVVSGVVSWAFRRYNKSSLWEKLQSLIR